MKHLFIINPVAGKGQTMNYKSQIAEIFKNRNDEYFIEVTKEKGHATEIVKSYTSKDDFRVYSVGGDGTLNEVLNGLINTNSSLAVIPSGTGNDFARTLLKDIDLKNILIDTIDGSEKYIDVAKANERFYINISSVGFDSEVVYNARLFKSKKFIPNHLSYIFSLFYTPFRFKSLDMKIKIDDLEFEQKNMLLAASNGKCYGGGIYITPDASIEDGLLDICMIKHTKLFKLLRFLPKAIKGNHGCAEEVQFFKAKQVSVESDRSFTLNADGELERLNKVTFEIIPNKVKIIVPNTKTSKDENLEVMTA